MADEAKKPGSWRCRWWFHDWGAWSEPQDSKWCDTHQSARVYTKTTQRRACRVCGILEEREVRPW